MASIIYVSKILFFKFHNRVSLWNREAARFKNPFKTNTSILNQFEYSIFTILNKSILRYRQYKFFLQNNLVKIICKYLNKLGLKLIARLY